MKLKILNPTSIIFDDEIDSLVVDTTKGKVGILPHHAPYLTTVAKGFCRFKKKDQTPKITIEKGLLAVNKNQIIIMIA
jgi:F-type H+-transporting ATPase subunit epsilon